MSHNTNLQKKRMSKAAAVVDHNQKLFLRLGGIVLVLKLTDLSKAILVAKCHRPNMNSFVTSLL